MKLLQKQDVFFHTGKTKAPAFRKRQLKKLYDQIRQREKQIYEALRLDLAKSEQETYLTEIGLVLSEIRTAIRSLDRWTRPRRVRSSAATLGTISRIYPEPFGKVLVMAPFNYPFQLALTPLVSALAAGNCVVLKPSELAPHTERLLKELIEACFPEEYCAVVCGDADTAKALLQEPFDFLFFTGSPAVGRKVYQAAAGQLIPAVLELGGKSPCIVEKSADLPLAARRIVWGKFLNAGQTCVAPDYLLAEACVKEELLSLMEKEIHRFYTEEPLRCESYPKLINRRHFERLQGMLGEGRIRIGGGADERCNRIEPTVIETDENGKLMQEEIFGPILPVIAFEEKEEVYRLIRKYEKPLALYLFTRDRALEREVLQNLSFGGGCINDTILHLCNERLPFGGVGMSGIGSYHGKRGFDTFTHEKSVVHSGKADLPLRYPPYGKTTKLIRALLK